jgi:hypothetical protein
VFEDSCERPLFLEIECSCSSDTDLHVWWMHSYVLNTNKILQTVQALARPTSIHLYRHTDREMAFQTPFLFRIQWRLKRLNLSRSLHQFFFTIPVLFHIHYVYEKVEMYLFRYSDTSTWPIMIRYTEHKHTNNTWTYYFQKHLFKCNVHRCCWRC